MKEKKVVDLVLGIDPTKNRQEVVDLVAGLAECGKELIRQAARGGDQVSRLISTVNVEQMETTNVHQALQKWGADSRKLAAAWGLENAEQAIKLWVMISRNERDKTFDVQGMTAFILSKLHGWDVLT